MEVALETGSLVAEGYNLNDSLDIAQKLGFKAVEIWIDRDNLWPFTVSENDISQTKQALDEKKIQCVSTCPVPFTSETWETFEFEFNLADPNENRRIKAVEFFKKAIDVSAQLEAEVVLIPPGKVEETNFMASNFSYRQYQDQLVKSLKECGAYAAQSNVILGIENTSVGNFCDTPYELKAPIEKVGLDNVKAYLDIANANIYHPPIEYLNELRGLLAECMHITDNDGIHAQHLPIGMGTINFPEVISQLKRIGWDGYLLPEIFYKEDPLEGLRISKRLLEKYITESS